MIVEAERANDAAPREVVTEADSPRVAQAINEVLGDASYRENARGIAAEMAATPTVDDVLDALPPG